MARIGYARVSTGDQSLDLQLDALNRAGCDVIFEDRGVSGAAIERPGLSQAFSALRPGDSFIVWRFDRFARSSQFLMDTAWSLRDRGINFESLTECVNIGTAFGELQLHIIAGMARFERALIIERTREGMAAAKARGVAFGRRPALDAQGLQEALHLIRQGMSVEQTARHLGVGRSTMYRYVNDVGKTKQAA